MSGIRIWQPALAVLLSLIVLRLASTPTATLSFVMLAAYALLGLRQAVHALLLVWLFVMLNPALAPAPLSTSLLRYLVLFCAAASVFMRSDFAHGRLRMTRVVFMTILLSMFIVLHSLAISAQPLISILKAISWALAVCTSLAAWGGMTMQERSQTSTEVFAVLIAVAAASIFLISEPYGYMKGMSLFRGVLVHSQALGPTLAVLGAWTVCLYLQRASWIYLGILGAVVPLTFMTGTRTALLAAILGVAVASVLTPILARESLRKHLPTLGRRRFIVAVLFGLVLTLIWLEPISNQLSDFLNKGRDYETIGAAYADSRGGLVETMMSNFRDKPFTGIGFGIASNPASMKIERIAGIPVSAVVEKGVTPIAVLEELGIFGALLAAVWLWIVVESSARSGLVPLGVLCTVLALNMGEATLFSPGGMGMLSIVLLGWAVSAARFCAGRKAIS